MKKVLCILLALLMVAALCACDSAANDTLIIIDEGLGFEEYGIAYRAADQEVCDAIQSAVDVLVANGTYAQIADKYKEISGDELFASHCYFLQADYKAAYTEVIQTEPRTFTMGIDPEYNPFSYMGDDGEYTGFDVEVCRAACELLGWDFQVFGVNWDNKLVQLDAMECDCVWSGMTIRDTMKDYVISKPYYMNTQVLVVKEKSGIKTSADLAGKVVAVQLGTSGEALLKEDLTDLTATFKNLVTCDSFLKCFTELDGNAVDAVFVDLPVAQSYVNSKNAK